MPFVCGGDYNSLPVSSVASVFYGENIENAVSWPLCTASVSEDDKHFYREVNQMFQRKANGGLIDPLFGNLKSAY